MDKETFLIIKVDGSVIANNETAYNPFVIYQTLQRLVGEMTNLLGSIQLTQQVQKQIANRQDEVQAKQEVIH